MPDKPTTVRFIIECLVNDCIYLHTKNEGIGVEAVIDQALTQIKEMLLSMRKPEILNRTICDKCGKWNDTEEVSYNYAIKEMLDKIG